MLRNSLPFQGPMHVRADDAEDAPRSVWAGLREIGIVLVVAVVISSLIRAFLVQFFWIPSPSMHDTLLEQDRIAVSRLSAWTGDIERGDVVVFNDELGWLPKKESTGVAGAFRKVAEFAGFLPANGEQTLVKRVIAVGGDTVSCCSADGRITVNDVAVTEPYLAEGQVPSLIPFSVTVPEGTVWVMGDNRGDSADSRFHMSAGQTPFVPVDAIVGRAVAVVWPFDRWSTLPGRDVFADVPSR